MKSVREIPVLQNIPVIVRGALNEPMDGEIVKDTFRLQRALPTLLFLQSKGARIVLISHLGQKGTETLEPIAKKLGQMIQNVSFCPVTVGEQARDAVRKLAPGDILVMENLRRNKGETANDPAFAKALAELGDVFVEDSFDTCHRKHASIVGLPQLLPSYAGLTLLEEVGSLASALHPARPSLAIIGGAKFATKEPAINALINAGYDSVFVAGALANDFIKAKGFDVGASLISDPPADPAKMKALLENPHVLMPIDALVANVGDGADKARVAELSDVKPGEMILDVGPATEALLASIVEKSKAVLWNGPLGQYETGFTKTTDKLAQEIAGSGARSIVGGGDTVTAIEALNILPRFSFVSEGGGAMLEFLAAGTLPGIAALG